MADLTGQQKSLASAKKKLDQGIGFEQLTPVEQDAIEAEYTFATELVLSDPGLMKLFTQAVKEQWSATRFTLEAQNISWFKDRNASQEWFQIEASRLGDYDPKQIGNIDYVKSKIAQSKDLQDANAEILRQVSDYAVTNLGLNVNDAATKAKLENVAADILSGSYAAVGGWQTKVAGKVGAAFSDIKPSNLGGTIADNMATIQKTYRSLGMGLSDSVASDYANQMITKTADVNTITANARKNASQMWSQFSDRIMAGESLQNILYPYTQLIGSMLEVDDASLDFTADDPTKPAQSQIDPLLQKALFSGADSKSVMSLTDLRKAIKKDSRWQYTKNAQSEYAGLTKEVMRMFGAGV